MKLKNTLNTLIAVLLSAMPSAGNAQSFPTSEIELLCRKYAQQIINNELPDIENPKSQIRHKFSQRWAKPPHVSGANECPQCALAHQ